MRKDARRAENSETRKNILYIGGSILGLGIIAFVITFILYGNKMDEQSEAGAGKIAALMQENENYTQSASTQMGKTVEESKNEISNVNTNTEDKSKTTNTKSTNTTKSENKTTENKSSVTNNSSKANTRERRK